MWPETEQHQVTRFRGLLHPFTMAATILMILLVAFKAIGSTSDDIALSPLVFSATGTSAGASSDAGSVQFLIDALGDAQGIDQPSLDRALRFAARLQSGRLTQRTETK